VVGVVCFFWVVCVCVFGFCFWGAGGGGGGGGAVGILQGMQAYVASLDVQAMGCQGLLYLASQDPICVGAMLDAGGLELLLASLARHAGAR